MLCNHSHKEIKWSSKLPSVEQVKILLVIFPSYASENVTPTSLLPAAHFLSEMCVSESGASDQCYNNTAKEGDRLRDSSHMKLRWLGRKKQEKSEVRSSAEL